MEEQSFDRGAYSYEPKKRSPKMIRLIAVGLVLVGVVVFLLNYFFFSASSTPKEVPLTPTPTDFVFPTDTPTLVPSASPTPTGTAKPKSTSSIDSATGLDRSTLTVEVQNGSGVVGAASKMAEILKSLGYTLGTIGNAPTYDFVDVTILTKATSGKFLPLLKKDLSTSYTIGSSSATLSASSSADAVVIVGK